MINNDFEFFGIIRHIESMRLDHTYDWSSDIKFFSEQVKEYNDRTSKDRIGDWTITPCGRRFWLLDPRPEDIHIDDIAKGLACLDRFNGQLIGADHYSVAEHCYVGSYEIDPEYALHFHLHDSPEAYTGDLIYPMKKIPELRKVYKPIEEKIERCIFTALGIDFNEDIAREVKRIDKRMLAQEMRQFTVYRKDLGMSDEKEVYGIVGRDRETAERLYLERFNSLYIPEPVYR